MTLSTADHSKDRITPPLTDDDMTTDHGFAAGTIVLTQKGEMPVEKISSGDRIITRDRGFVAMRTVRKGRCRVRAVSIAAGSLGDTRPDQDLILPAGQKVLIRDWRAQAMYGADRAMVRADALVDGEFICDLGLQDMVIHQLQFDTPHVLYVGGLELAAEPDDSALSRAA